MTPQVSEKPVSRYRTQRSTYVGRSVAPSGHGIQAPTISSTLSRRRVLAPLVPSNQRAGVSSTMSQGASDGERGRTEGSHPHRPSTILEAQSRLRATGGLSMWHTRSGRLQVYQQAPGEQGSTESSVRASKTSANKTLNLTQGTTITTKATTGTGGGLPPTLQRLIKRTVVLPTNQTRPGPPAQAVSPDADHEAIDEQKNLSTSERGKGGFLNTSRYRTIGHHQDKPPQPLPLISTSTPAIEPRGVERFQCDQRESYVAARVPCVPSHHREDQDQHLISGHTSVWRGKRGSRPPSVSAGNISQSNTGQQLDPTQDQIEIARRLAPVEIPGQTTSLDYWGCVDKRELVSQPAEHNSRPLKQEIAVKQELRSDDLPENVDEFVKFEEFERTPLGHTRYVDGSPPLQPADSRPAKDNQGSLVPRNPTVTTDTQPWHDFRCDESEFPDYVDEYSDEIFAYMRTKEIELAPAIGYLENTQSPIWMMRTSTVEIMSRVCYLFNMRGEVLFMAVNLLDRVLSQSTVEGVFSQGLVCVLISCKFEDRLVAMTARCYVDTLNRFDYGLDHKAFQESERRVLRILNYDVGWPGPLSFLRRSSRADECEEFARTVAKYLLEVIILSERFLLYKPSMQAAAALYVGRKMRGQGDWPTSFEKESGYTLQELRAAAEDMIEYMGNTFLRRSLLSKSTAPEMFSMCLS